MSRPIIQCPRCGRELYQLRRPQCIWCGARLSEELFEQVALPHGTPPSPLPQPMPLMPPLSGTPQYGRGWGLFEGNPFSLIKRTVSPRERRLRIVGAALFVLVILARLGYISWSMWQVSHLMPPHR